MGHARGAKEAQGTGIAQGRHTIGLGSQGAIHDTRGHDWNVRNVIKIGLVLRNSRTLCDPPWLRTIIVSLPYGVKPRAWKVTSEQSVFGGIRV